MTFCSSCFTAKIAVLLSLLLGLVLLVRDTFGEELAVFERLPLEHPATAMALTADGAQLVVAHANANLLSVWSVADGNLVREVDCKSPMYVVCRDHRVFVANGDECTLSIYDIHQDWKFIKAVTAYADKTRPYRIPVAFLSAAKGEYFDHKILTTRTGTEESSCLIDIGNGEWNNVGGYGLPRKEVSYDGATYMAQDFGERDEPVLKPIDKVGARHWKSAPHKGTYPRLYQPYAGDLWIGGARIFRNSPVEPVSEQFGQMLIADQSQELLYALDDGRLKAVTFSVDAVVLAERPARLPPWVRTIQGEWPGDDIRRAILPYRGPEKWGFAGNPCEPQATSQGKRLYLFVLDSKWRTIHRCETEAFSASAAVADHHDSRGDYQEVQP